MKRSHLVGLGGLFVVGAGLYLAKIEGQEARERLTQLEQTIVQDRRAVRVLEAEVAFLERSDRLETAAREGLGLAPIATAQRVPLDALPVLLQADADAAATPAAPVPEREGLPPLDADSTTGAPNALPAGAGQ